MKKSIFLFFAAILCAIGAKAINQSNVDLYFDNSTSQWTNCYVYIGHDSYTSCYSMTRVSGTQYLWKLAKGFNSGNAWNNASGWVVCKEKWWDSKNGENVYKFVYHGNNNVTNIRTSVWNATTIYKADGTTNVNHFSTACTVYKWSTSTKSDYKVTINTVTGGTLTVKDYDNATVSNGASKIKLTVLKFSATPADGYVLDGVEINDGTNTTTIAAADLASKTYTLTSAVTITPVWHATTSTVTVTATATNGTVTGGGVVEEGTSVTLTATPADGYKFVNWTVGGAEVSTANPYTFTAEEDVTVVANFEELPKETVYFVNNKNWSKINAYAWNSTGNNGWPGQAMTATGEQVAGFDVYSYTAIEGNANVIFNDGSAQTADYVWTNGNYYYMGADANYAGGTKEEVAKAANPDPLATEVYLAGAMNSWNSSSTAFRKATAEGTTASVSIELTAGTHEFKIVDNGAWYGNDGTMDREYHDGWTFSVKKANSDEDQVNAKIKADIAGTYTFTWDMTSKKLTVTYPALPKYQVTATVNPAETGEVTGTGEYEQGKTATLTATANDHYVFVNWTVGGTEVSTANPYTFTVEGDVELVANFLPTYTINVTTDDERGTIEGAGTYTQGAEVTLIAEANPNYKFLLWRKKGEEVEYSKDNPLRFTATENVDLRAEFVCVQRIVTVTAENGTVTAANGLVISKEASYPHGAEAKLTATPAEGYEFVNWTKGGEVVSTEPTYTFTITEDVELVANFKKHETTIHIEPGNGKLSGAILTAFPGDTIILADGEYTEEESFKLNKAGIIVKADEGAKPVIKASSYMEHYATITFIGITFDGQNTAEHGIYSYENTCKSLTLIDCEIRNYKNYLITCSSDAHVDSLVIEGCLLHDCGDAAVYFQETTLEDDVPTCSYFKMINSTVYNINGTQYYAAIDIRENTAAYGKGGNEVIIDHVTIYNYTTPLGAIRVYKSPELTISNSIVANPTAVNYSLYIYGGAVNNTLYFNGAADSRGEYTNCLNVDPLFVDAANGNFALKPLSPARGAATDGSDLGDPRWYTSVNKYTVTATANPAEAGTVSGAGEYIEGVAVTLVATPKRGYSFVNWTVEGEEVSMEATYTFTPSADIELVANFEEIEFTGNIINVEPGKGTLATAVENAEAGDKIVLADGIYTQEYSIAINKAGLIITAAEGAKPVIQLTDTFTVLEVSATTTFDGITFDATNVAKYIIAALDSEEMDAELTIINCEFKNWTLWAISNQYANNVSVRSVVIDNCLFHDGTGAAISFSNNAPEGKQACEYFEMTNSTLYKILESSYRGIINVGSNPEAEGDYNTVVIDHITMYDYTLINSGIAAIAIRKTHNLRISNSIIANPEENGKTALNVYGGTVDNTIHYNGAKRSGSTVYTNCYNTDPMFTHAEHGIFCLQEGSPAIGAATDGTNLGDPRWNTPHYLVELSVNKEEAGTVTGAGIYEHGATATLTATPAFDYEFVKWSNESTENPLTITVEDNIALEAIFAEVAATEKKESGVFSISAHKTATFATGNLQHNVGTGEWRFAKQQYQVVGEQNINLGDPAFSGWIDMLGWSTNDEGNNFGVNPSNVNELYDGEFVDWGTKMGAEWSTLSADEWKYLLNTRENAATLKQIAKVGDILGLLLFHDAWVMPEGVEVEAEMDAYFEVNIYNYTLEQWTKLEQAGAIFLPAAGRRTGGYGNMINYDQVEETDENNLNGGFYRHQDNTNIYCYYWTSTINEETKNVSYLHNIVALGNDEYTIGNGAIWGEKGRYGQSVRLAKVVYDKHEVTVTAENGTVTGAGTYTHGTEVTLTATPDFDYEFVKWSNESTDNPLTITVTDNETLEAIFAEVAATEKKESGVFSISAHKTATFATGNLQHNVGTGEWRFAKQQYQVVGEQNINLGDPAFSGWIDMLGWSTNDEGNNFGVNPSNVNELYDGEFVDWGSKMGEEWSTLSADDWKYLLNTRENAAALKQIARVGEMVGLLLFPDAWTMPEGCTVEAQYDDYFNVNIYNYTLAQWAKMEAEGAMFLPAAGRRTGGYGNMINYDQVEETNPEMLNGGYYRHQDNTNIYCYYWTSTINEETKNVSYLHNIVALGNDEYTIGTGAIWGEKGRYGQSVRLAKVAYDKHTVTATAENGTVTGAGEYTHGDTVTLTATANEHYVFVNWTKGEEVVAETAEYTFTVEADVNLVANFKKQIVHTAITAEDAIVRLIDGVLYFNGVLEDGTPYQVTLNEYTEVGDYTNISWTTYGEDEVEVVGAQANVNGEEGKLTLTATVANETNSYGLTISGILPAAEEDVKEVESLVYTLTPAGGSNNGYANNCDITIDGITWNLTGNSTMQPWRIGGKNLTNQDCALYSKTPLGYNINKIEVTHGTANSITVNSFKLIISDEANGAGETIDVAFKANATTTIDLPEGDYTNKYFKFVYNVTVGNSNKFIEFTGAKFYATTTIEANPAPEAPAFTGEANFVGSTEVELNTTEENINIYYTLTDDYTLPTAGYMYAESVEVTETTTVKAIAHNTLTGKISEIAEKTFTKAELYTIKWSVNGEVSETTEVVQGNTLTLPADPTAPEACGSKVFMGWATTSSVNANGTDITYVNNETTPTDDATYYAVFAIQTAAGETEEIVDEYIMSNYTAGTQYATEEHKLDEKLTLHTVECHFTTQLRIYSSSTHNGYVYSNQLPAIIKSMSFTAGNKFDQLVVYGSTDGATWNEVGQISVTSTSYKTYELSFGNSDYTYFKLDVAGDQQIRISGFSITYKSGETYTYSEYSTTCSGTGTDVENIEVKGKSVKMIVNGQLIIIKNGVTYNAQGQVVK